MTPKSKKCINIIAIDQVDDDIESVDQKAETALADFEDMDRLLHKHCSFDNQAKHCHALMVKA